MRILIVLMFLITMNSCVVNKQKPFVYHDTFSLKDDINNSIIDGFYDNDTIGISKNIRLLR